MIGERRLPNPEDSIPELRRALGMIRDRGWSPGIMLGGHTWRQDKPPMVSVLEAVCGNEDDWGGRGPVEGTARWYDEIEEIERKQAEAVRAFRLCAPWLRMAMAPDVENFRDGEDSIMGWERRACRGQKHAEEIFEMAILCAMDCTDLDRDRDNRWVAELELTA